MCWNHFHIQECAQTDLYFMLSKASVPWTLSRTAVPSPLNTHSAMQQQLLVRAALLVYAKNTGRFIYHLDYSCEIIFTCTSRKPAESSSTTHIQRKIIKVIPNIL